MGLGETGWVAGWIKGVPEGDRVGGHVAAVTRTEGAIGLVEMAPLGAGVWGSCPLGHSWCLRSGPPIALCGQRSMLVIHLHLKVGGILG